MIPFLYGKYGTAFPQIWLPEAISCEVTEELNGEYTLQMRYSVDGENFHEIKDDSQIVAKANDIDEYQVFKISGISKPINGIVTISARHISYTKDNKIIYPITNGEEWISNDSIEAAEKLSIEIADGVEAVEGELKFEKPTKRREAIFGNKGSFISVYGGEIEQTNYGFVLHKKRGKNRGVRIVYGVNLIDYRQESNIAKMYSGFFPFCGKASNGSYIDLRDFDSAGAGGYDQIHDVWNDIFHWPSGSFGDFKTLAERYEDEAIVDRVIENLDIVDFSSELENGAGQEELFEAAKVYWEKNKQKYGVPEVSIDVSFVELAKTEEYKDLLASQKIGIGDEVEIVFAKIGTKAKARVQKTVYDSLSERYIKIHIGDAKKGISDTVAELVSERS